MKVKKGNLQQEMLPFIPKFSTSLTPLPRQNKKTEIALNHKLNRIAYKYY
jgi:hypothetical protein